MCTRINLWARCINRGCSNNTKTNEERHVACDAVMRNNAGFGACAKVFLQTSIRDYSPIECYFCKANREFNQQGGQYHTNDPRDKYWAW